MSTIEQGIELLTGLPAGAADEQGNYAEGTIYAAVQRKLTAYREALQAEAKPRRNGNSNDEAAPEEDPPEQPPLPEHPVES